MLTFLLGLPGSGKTNLAVDKIFNNFSLDDEAKKDKKISFKNCYTNINQFKFDKVENVYKLDFDKLYDIIKIAHKLYKQKKSDDYLVKFFRRLKLKDTLFVIDEAHNYFDTKDKYLVWWLSYHRHFYHEIILITQSLGLIESKYKSFSEFFYVAKPNSLRLFKSHFKYNIFTHSRLTKASAVGSIKIKLNDKVFALYKSGDSIDSKNLVLKYILISLGIFVLLIGFFYFFISNKTNSIDVTDPGQTSVTLQHKQSVTHQDKKIIEDDIEELYNEDLENKIFLKLSCSYNKCSNKTITIPPQLLKIFIDKKFVKPLYIEKVNKRLSHYYLDTTKEFYSYLIPNKGENNEEYENESSSLDMGSILGTNSK